MILYILIFLAPTCINGWNIVSSKRLNRLFEIVESSLNMTLSCNQHSFSSSYLNKFIQELLERKVSNNEMDHRTMDIPCGRCYPCSNDTNWSVGMLPSITLNGSETIASIKCGNGVIDLHGPYAPLPKHIKRNGMRYSFIYKHNHKAKNISIHNDLFSPFTFLGNFSASILEYCNNSFKSLKSGHRYTWIMSESSFGFPIQPREWDTSCNLATDNAYESIYSSIPLFWERKDLFCNLKSHIPVYYRIHGAENENNDQNISNFISESCDFGSRWNGIKGIGCTRECKFRCAHGIPDFQQYPRWPCLCPCDPGWNGEYCDIPIPNILNSNSTNLQPKNTNTSIHESTKQHSNIVVPITEIIVFVLLISIAVCIIKRCTKRNHKNCKCEHIHHNCHGKKKKKCFLFRIFC